MPAVMTSGDCMSTWMACCVGRLNTRVHWWMSYGGSWRAWETSCRQVSSDLVHSRQNLDNEIDS